LVIRTFSVFRHSCFDLRQSLVIRASTFVIFVKHTPLYAAHQQLGAKLIEFGGWEMPVYYTSIMEEHQAVRTAAGLFDISHMGEIRVTGRAAAEFLNGVLTNDLRKLTPGLGQYTLLCNERGGVVDDLYVYCIEVEKFLLIVNASRIEADALWLDKQLAAYDKRDAVELKNASDNLGAVAVQGPKVAGFIDSCFETITRAATSLRKNEIARFNFSGHPVLVSRTGYTGEDGFEVVAPAQITWALWNKIMDAGRPFGLKPAGLGARDTLRTEACYPLYGHELDENTTPLEAGLGFFVAFDKGDFAGRAVLAEKKAKGTAKKLAAFKMVGRSAPPRPLYPIWSTGAKPERIGAVTSGTQSPTLGVGIGLGYVPPSFAAVNTAIGIEIRGQQASALVVPKPFYRKS
jgi:aminomethyltransferase